VPRLTTGVEANLATIDGMVSDAASKGAELILLPEAVLTGLRINDEPARDLQLGQHVPGPATCRLGALCSHHGIWLGFGMLERCGGKLYDSAVLLGSDGSTELHYRRNHPGWHAREVEGTIYGDGADLPVISTPFGRVAFLICGDLFDDGLVSRFSRLDADLMLYPFARAFPGGEADQRRWDLEELPEYAGRVGMAGSTALMVNYLADDGSFGGAFVISGQGEVLASHPLGTEGILMYETEQGVQE